MRWRHVDPGSLIVIFSVLAILVSGATLVLFFFERSNRIEQTDALICDLGTATREQTEAFRAIALRVPPGAFRTDLERAITAGERLERELGDTCD